MQELKTSLVLAVLVGLAGAAHAQDAATPGTEPAPEQPSTEQPAGDAVTGSADGLSLGEPATADGDGIGSTYTEATHGEWQVRCVRTEDGSDPCQLYQLLQDGEGNSVAEVSLFALPAGQQAAAGATIVTPLETLLTQQITLAVDSATPKRYPFTWCSPIGCVARVGFTAEEVTALKRGNKATLTIVPMAAPDQKVDLDISLIGFTAGYDQVAATNAE